MMRCPVCLEEYVHTDKCPNSARLLKKFKERKKERIVTFQELKPEGRPLPAPTRTSTTRSI